MSKSSVWSLVRSEQDVDPITIPCWAIPIMRKLSIVDGSEIVVFLYFLSKVTDDPSLVYVVTREAVEFLGITPRTYYRVIEKFKGIGLSKIGNGCYDLTRFFETMKAVDNA